MKFIALYELGISLADNMHTDSFFCSILSYILCLSLTKGGGCNYKPEHVCSINKSGHNSFTIVFTGFLTAFSQNIAREYVLYVL